MVRKEVRFVNWLRERNIAMFDMELNKRGGVQYEEECAVFKLFQSGIKIHPSADSELGKVISRQ